MAIHSSQAPCMPARPDCRYQLRQHRVATRGLAFDSTRSLSSRCLQTRVFDMKSALEGRIQRAEEIANTLTHFKREVALAAEHSKSGRPISEKLLADVEAKGEIGLQLLCSDPRQSLDCDDECCVWATAATDCVHTWDEQVWFTPCTLGFVVVTPLCCCDAASCPCQSVCLRRRCSVCG